MLVCPSCGHENREGAKFCEECGFSFAAAAAKEQRKTDMLFQQGDAYADLAEVLLLAGKPDEAAAALEQAVERYERKGDLVSTQRAQTRLAELHDAASR